MIVREKLPTDADELKGIIYQLLDVLEEQKRLIANQNERIETQFLKIEEQSQRIDRLTAEVNSLKRHRYGKRSEKVQDETPVEDSVNQKEDSPDGYEQKRGHGRKRLPQHLPRHKVHHQIKASERVCDCCGSFLTKIGEQVYEQLELIPAKVYVIEHIRHKYACRKCEGNVVIAKMPEQPIDKGKAGPNLLADVLVSKYQDHMPLYRQSQRYSRFGIELSRSTLCDWIMKSALLLSPLVEAMKEKALIPCGHLFSDDTSIRTLNCEEGGAKTGRFWIYTSKGSEKYPACTVYNYTPDRQGVRPVQFLNNYKGYFQADAYSGYDRLYEGKDKKNSSVMEVACWAHARRKFYEVAQQSSKEGLANQALNFIKDLYKIEKLAKEKNLGAEEIKKWRETHAPPILNQFQKWLLEQKNRVLPKSQLAGAISYTLNHWKALNAYLLEGYLEIDNNRSERGIRPLAIGRKNYLFVGSETGGEAAAIIYSLVASCKQHGVNPLAYFQDVLKRLPSHLNSKIEELLPYYWKDSSIERTQDFLSVG